MKYDDFIKNITFTWGNYNILINNKLAGFYLLLLDLLIWNISCWGFYKLLQKVVELNNKTKDNATYNENDIEANTKRVYKYDKCYKFKKNKFKYTFRKVIEINILMMNLLLCLITTFKILYIIYYIIPNRL